MKTLYAVAIDRFGKDGFVDFRFAVLVSSAEALLVNGAVLNRLQKDTPGVRFEVTSTRRVCQTSDDVHMQFCA